MMPTLPPSGVPTQKPTTRYPTPLPTVLPTMSPTEAPKPDPLYSSFDSGWFTMESQQGDDSFSEFKHYIGRNFEPEIPAFVQVYIKAEDGNNAGFVFHGMGAAMGDDTRNYGGVIFAYSDRNVRLWAPDVSDDSSNGYIVNIYDGWGGEVNTQRSNTASVRVKAKGNCSINYHFDSGWFNMSAQSGTDSYKEMSHGLGVIPGEVRVLTRAIDGNNKGFVFEGMGHAQSDDDIGNGYGGVVFGYNSENVRLWAPDKNANELGSHGDGAIIYVGDGWGGEMNAQSSMDAEVRVMARATLPCGDADFDSGWFTMNSQAGTNSFTEVMHGLGELPEYVRVLLKATDGNNVDYVFEGMGNAQTDDANGAYGGVIYGYSATAVRIWAPDRNNDKYTNGRITSIIDGWGGETNTQYSNNGEVRVMAWRNCTACQ